MGSVGNTIQGLDKRWVDFADWSLKGNTDAFNEYYEKSQREFAQMMLDAGAFGDENISVEEAQQRLDWIYAEKLSYNYDDNVARYPHTPAVGLARWKNGAWAKGYGDSREAFDKMYGISDFIDNNPQLQFNSNDNLYRGLRTTDSELRQLYSALENGDMINMRGLSSWTVESGVADRFTETTLVGKSNPNTVVFVDTTKGRRRAMPYPYSMQDEVLVSGNVNYQILGIEKRGKNYYVKVKQK